MSNDTPKSARWVSGVPDLFFACTHGVFSGPEGGASLCYTTSEERARWIATQLNQLAASQERERALREALEDIASYDKNSKYGEGICPYGCDCPNLARTALAATKPADVGSNRSKL